MGEEPIVEEGGMEVMYGETSEKEKRQYSNGIVKRRRNEKSIRVGLYMSSDRFKGPPLDRSTYAYW